MNLEFDTVSKIYGNHAAIDQMTLCVPAFQTLVFIGPSGSGKSTALKLIAGLEKPDTGRIKIGGKAIPTNENDLATYRQSLGIVFQSLNLFPHLTALENISLPLFCVHGYSKQDAGRTAMTLLKRFELENHAHKKPYELSGGQSQRVAIVRAVAIRPKLLILDEPTSSLDPLMTVEVFDLINELKMEGSHLIMASHHLGFVNKISDWVAFMSEGRLIECKPTQDFFSQPASIYVKQFLNTTMKY